MRIKVSATTLRVPLLRPDEDGIRVKGLAPAHIATENLAAVGEQVLVDVIEPLEEAATVEPGHGPDLEGNRDSRPRNTDLQT